MEVQGLNLAFAVWMGVWPRYFFFHPVVFGFFIVVFGFFPPKSFLPC